MIEPLEGTVWFCDQRKGVTRIGVEVKGFGRKKVIIATAGEGEQYDIGERVLVTIRRPEAGE